MRRRRPTLGTCFGLLAARLKPKRRCVRPRALIRRSRKLGTIFPTCWTSKVAQKQQSIACDARSRLHRTNADAVFNLALLLHRGSRHKELAEFWRQYLANDALSEWAARARRSLKFCEMQIHLSAS